MATLEKPKPKKRISQSIPSAITVNTSTNTKITSNENTTTATTKNDNNSTIIDKELEQLVLEPINYDDIYQKEKEGEEINNNNILTKELEQSIQTVKSVCLQSLDSLLRLLVDDVSTTTKAERRLSDSSLHDKLMENHHHSLLGSIAQTTNSLNFINDQQKQLMKRSESSPAMTTLSNVQKMLNTHQAWFLDTTSDYNLCCALAALLLHLYRILELNNNNNNMNTSSSSFESPLSPTSITSPLSPSSSVYSQLRESMNLLQKEKENNNNHMKMKNIKSNKKKGELSTLWEELDHLIDAVTCLAHDRPALDSTSPPPAYHDIILTNDHNNNKTPTSTTKMMINDENEKDEKKESSSTTTTSSFLLPEYTTSKKQNNEKTRYDLDNLLTAMDRLSTLTPTRLNNQRVTMTEKQSKELAAATMGKTIERLSRGRMENQRASLPDLLSKQTMLQDLMSQIQRSAIRSSSLDNQRVMMEGRIKKKMEIASINKLMDRVNRGRLVNQDWKSPEEIMIDEMTDMTDMLTKMMNRPQFNRQRFSLSDVKEREIFMDRIFQKVDKMEKRRMSNQDAEWSSNHQQQQKQKQKKRSLEMEDELNHLFDHIHKSKTQLDNQRASFTTTTSVTTTSPSLVLSSNLL